VFSLLLNVFQSVAERRPSATIPSLVGITNVNVVVDVFHDKKAVCPAIVIKKRVITQFLFVYNVLLFYMLCFCKMSLMNNN
jgi:hypothetical protein